jgi:hypothetical protein
MTDIAKILLTSGLTVIGGSFVLLIQRFVLEPLNEQSRVLGRVAFAMHYYGREYTFPLDPREDAASKGRYWAVADCLRKLGSSLAETSQSVRWYWLWLLLGFTPRRKKINDAIRLLTRMSGNMFAFNETARDGRMKQNSADADEVATLLGLRRWG